MEDENTVDSLQIEIESSSTEAEKRIDSLTAVLERLKKATTGFGNVGDRIKEIGRSAESSAGAAEKHRREALDRATRSLKPKTVDSDTANEIISIDKQAEEVKEKIKDLEGYLATFNPSSKAYSQMNEELERQKGILDELIAKRKELNAALPGKDTSKQFGSQWDVIKSQFSGSTLGDIVGDTGSIDEAVEKMVDLNDQVSILNVKLEGLQEKLRGAFESGNQTQIANYTEKIQNLKKQIEKLRTHDSDTGQIETSGSLNEKLTILQKIRSLFDGFKPVPLTETEQFIEATSKMDVLQSKAYLLKDSIQEALENGDTGKAIDLVGKYQRVQEQIDKIDDKSKNLKGIFESLSSPIRSLKNELKKIGGVGFSEIKKFGKSFASRLTSPFKNAIKTVEKWKSAIGRIAFYRIVRNAIKMISDGFRDGASNLYQYSKIVKTDFAPAMDKISTSSLYIKNSLGAMAAPLIEAVAPAVDMLADKFVELTNAIGKTFAAMTGKDVYSQAKKHAVEYAESADDAKKKTEDFKKFLLGIDELNIMPSQEENKGASNPLEDYASMFEEVAVPKEQMDWAKQVQEAIEDGDWQLAGKTVANKLNNILDEWDPYGWGTRLGRKINDGLNAAYGFLKEFDFKNLGFKVADFFNGIFDTVDWNLLGRTFAAGWNGLFDFIYGFITGFHWYVFGKAVADAVVGFFSEINWGRIIDILQAGIEAVRLAFLGLLSGFGESLGIEGITGPLIEIVNTVANSLQTMINDTREWFGQLDFTPLVSSFESLLSAISPFVEIVSSGLAWAWNNVLLPLAGWFIEDAAPAGIELLSSALQFLNEVLKAIAPVAMLLWDSILKPIASFIGGTFVSAINLLSSAMQGISSIIQNFIEGVSKAVDAVKSFFNVSQYSRIQDNTSRKLQASFSSMDSFKAIFPVPSPQAYASGGFPERGQMFIAREAGPELVGKIGQKTTVANNEQITSGIADGVRDANSDVVNAVYAMASMIVKAVEDKNTDITLDGQSLTRGMQPYQQRLSSLQGTPLVN